MNVDKPIKPTIESSLINEYTAEISICEVEEEENDSHKNNNLNPNNLSNLPWKIGEIVVDQR